MNLKSRPGRANLIVGWGKAAMIAGIIFLGGWLVGRKS